MRVTPWIHGERRRRKRHTKQLFAYVRFVRFARRTSFDPERKDIPPTLPIQTLRFILNTNLLEQVESSLCRSWMDELDHLISKVSDICFNHNSSLFHLITSSTLVPEPRINDVYLPNVHKFFETSSSRIERLDRNLQEKGEKKIII